MKQRRRPSARPGPVPELSPCPPPAFTAALIEKLTRLRPTLAIVLGSGFQEAISSLRIEKEIPYRKLPGFPPTGVHGHAGRLMLGRFGDAPVLILCGRAHYYEGHSMGQVTFAMRVLAALGIRDVLLTNAAGGIHPRFRPGDFMGLTDHINGMGANPLRGPIAPGRERFVDMTRVYDERLTGLLRRAGRATGVRMHSGVYLAVSGPSYETPAEIQAFARWGADAVGMSTVPEAMVARQCKMQVAGLSCITNLAAGRGNALLSHADVLGTGDRVKVAAALLVETFVGFYAQRH